jgi:hypothetical protein
MRAKRLSFQTEADLENYLQLHLTLHLSLLGLDLLIIGRQSRTPVRGVIDLLAIDATGIIYIIELKLNRAPPSVIGQVLAYRRSIKRVTKAELIHIAARAPLQIDLAKAFLRRFGHPMPETLDGSPALIIIGTSFQATTAESVMELRESGYSVTAYRYGVQSDALSLIECCRDEDGWEPRIARLPRQRQAPAPPSQPNRSPGYSPRIDARYFWLTHAHRFSSSLVTFRSVYELYAHSVRNEPADGLSPLSEMVFGRHLAAIVKNSVEWNRVFLPPGSSIDAYAPLTDAPSVRARRDAGHWIVAYQRNAVDSDGDASSTRS